MGYALTCSGIIVMRDLLQSDSAICIGAGRVVRAEPRPLALLPGSFNPLHQGHITLAAVASARLGVPVHFELSISNVDKPELSLVEVDQRLAQFDAAAPVWVTRAATFAEKSALFPGTAFVVGWDTAERLIDPAYHRGSSGRDDTLRLLFRLGNRIVVGGRLDAAGRFRVWERCLVAEEFAELFIGLTEHDFRVDISSRVLRARAAGE
jgi:hypothetical protein